MTYQVLARKWRPRSFEQLIGQEHVARALINGLDQGRLHHAFLFTGTRGIGKTTIARILAKCLNCEQGVSSKPCGKCASCVDIDEGRFVDMLEVDAASRTGVDDMRELLESVQYTPTRGRFKVYIIDEVHMLSQNSFNALLKTLEEPPPHVKFVLATTDPEKVPVTILSRCLRFNLRRLSPDEIRSALGEISRAEAIEAEDSALESLARAADGSMRDALSLLDQATAYGGGRLSRADVAQMLGLVEHGHLAALLEALSRSDGTGLLGTIEELWAHSCNPATVLSTLAEVLHRISLLHCVPEYRDRDRPDWASIVTLSEKISAEAAQLYYQIAIKGAADLGLAPDPRTGLEMTLLRMLAFRPQSANAAAPAAGQGEVESAAKGTAPRAGRAAVASGRETRAAPKAGDTAGARQSTQGDCERMWVSMVGELAISGQVRELARNLHLHSAEGGDWNFVIAPSLRHLGSAQCVGRLGEAISRQLGHTVSISLTDGPEQSLLTAAAIRERGKQKKQSEAERAIHQDETVKALKERLGATIVEDSIQPLQ